MITTQFLTDWALRSSILILSGAFLLWVLRVKDASIRLASWTAMLCGSLAIPLLIPALPKVPLTVAHVTHRTVEVPAVIYEVELATPMPHESVVPGNHNEVRSTKLSKPFDWAGAAVILYLLVVGALLLRLCAGLVISLHLRRDSHATGKMIERIEIRESEEVTAPVTLGIVRPAIFLPIDWRQWDDAKLLAVLAHERAHIRRYDPAVQLLSVIHRALLWYSPLSWFLHQRVVRAAEEASDDAAIAAIYDRAFYAEILLDFMQRGVRGQAQQGVPMARYGSPDARIHRILDSKVISRGVTRWSVAAILALGLPLAYLVAATHLRNAELPAQPGQSAPTLLSFEAADVHRTRPRLYTNFRSDSFLTTLFVAGRYELHIASMADLIRTAYGMDAEAMEQSSSERLFGGPTWLETERFEVIAKAPTNSTQADLRLMLQALLAKRFNLVLHRAEAPVDVFALTQGNKLLLKESLNPGKAGCKAIQPKVGGPHYSELNCHNIPMADLVKQLRDWGWNDLKHPIVDLTGLKGSYDFSLKWTPWGIPPSGEDNASPYISFFDAVDKQLGLKLEAAKQPMPVLVIDRVNRMPTENVPGVAEILGAPTEFEAASVKPSRPDDPNHRIQALPGGRVEVENMPLKTLIAYAWNMEAEEKLIADAPKWVDSAYFDIIAEAGNLPPQKRLPLQDFQNMLQVLLKERFKLVAHQEDRSVPVWSLMVGSRGPNLKEGDPAGRSGCLWQPDEQRAGSIAAPTANLVCRNVSMAQLADTLHGAARGYVDHPAIDNTGLKGVYDFTLTYNPKPVAEALWRLNQGAEGKNGKASLPAEITLFEALENLGLRLESGQMHLEPVLVIDHLEALVPDKRVQDKAFVSNAP